MLNELCELYGISGMEGRVRDYLHEKLNPFCNRLRIDSMGNLHAEKKGRTGKKTVLLGVYMDEPGIIVTQITDDGYLKFEIVGRVRPEFLVSKRVVINGHLGIISLKAVHLVTKKEREKPVKTSQLFVDIGADTREEAEKVVELGDYGLFDSSFEALGHKFVKGRGLAGRIGCTVAAKLLEKDRDCNLYVIFATQREIGNRGMLAASWGVDADISILLDGIDAKTWTEKKEAPEAGKGAVLLWRTGTGTLDRGLVKEIQSLATKNKVALQSCTTEDIGQEAVLQQSGHNHQILCFGIPVRYQKSMAQMANISDIESLEKLVELAINLIEDREEDK